MLAGFWCSIPAAYFFLATGFFVAAFLPDTAALNPAPAVNLGTVVAAILSSLPVCGLRPVRAARLDDLKPPPERRPN